LASLIGQTIAVAAGALLIHALLRRHGGTIGVARAAALTVIAVLAVAGVANYRENWEKLRVQRTKWSGLPADAALRECALSTGTDPYFLEWLKARIRENERFYIPLGPDHANRICMRMLLLPRLQEDRVEDARYAVLLGDTEDDPLPEFRRRGATVERYDRERVLVTLP
jgi:hypothetical protein